MLAWLGLVPVAFGLFVLSFYRDPERQGPADPSAWVSPADGVVTDIATVDEPHYLGGKALRVGIFLSPLNVHVNRAPVAGTVEAVVARPGLCLPATGPSCIDQNESTLLGLRTDQGLRVGVRQVTGALARTIVCGATVGQRLGRGDRYGMIKLGSRTELLVPVDAGFTPAVALGDVVRGGETVLGRLGAPAATGKDAAASEAHAEGGTS
jgi:phosphatidylserine decarboxylase